MRAIGLEFLEMLKYRFLTTQSKNCHPAWIARVEMLPGWQEYVERFWKTPRRPTFWNDFRWALRFFSASKRYPAVITGSERSALLFAVMQTCMRRRPVPHILIECLWDVPNSRLTNLLKRLWLLMVLRSVAQVIVHTSRQIAEYGALLGDRAARKLIFVPCHTTLYDRQYQASEGDYIFSGGDSKRDYATLIQAMKDLPYPLIIAAHSDHHFRGVTIPSHVRLVTGGISFDEFYRLLAQAALVVVPMKSGTRYPGGQQVYENAMAIGKPLIVADDFGADEYIKHGETGVIVPSGNVPLLRAAISRQMSDHTSSRGMAAKARSAARDYTPERFFERVFQIVDTCITANRTWLRNRAARTPEFM